MIVPSFSLSIFMFLFPRNGRASFIHFALISSLCLFSAIAGEREDRELIAQLGAEDSSLREQAEKKIQSKGKSILPLLQEAKESNDPEIAERAQKILTNILLGIPLDKDSPQVIFINQYKEAGDEEKMELLGDFLLRDDASFQEIRTATLTYIQSPPAEIEKDDSPEWILNIYFSAINKENKSLLNAGKVAEAVELWSDVEIAPFIRKKYASMLFYTDTPLDRSRFSDDTANLIEAEIALLNREPEKAHKLAGDLDPELSMRAAAAQFDLEGSLTPLLESSYTASTCPPDKLLALWTLARSQNNEDVQHKIVSRLTSEVQEFIENTTQKNQHSTFSDYDDFGPFSTPLVKAKLLLSMGEYEKGTALISQLLSRKAIVTERCLSCFDYVDSLNFDLRQLGAADDSLPALLDLAGSIQPLTPANKHVLPFPSMYDDSMTGELEVLPDQDRITLQRLMLLGVYAFSRGETDKIFPYIVAHIEQIDVQHKYCLAFSYISAFISNNAQPAAYLLMEQFHRKNWLNRQNLDRLSSPFFIALPKEEAKSILTEFIHKISTDKPSHLETLRRTLVLLTQIPGKEEEYQNLFNKALAYIDENKESSPEKIDLFSQVLIDFKRAYALGSITETSQIIEKRGHPYWSALGCGFNANVALEVELANNKKVNEMYVSFYKKTLGTSALFPEYRQDKQEPVPEPEDEEDLYFLSLGFDSKIAEMGEYMAAHLHRAGDQQGANALRKKTRLYVTNEDNVRLMNARLLYDSPISIKEYLFSISPAFSSSLEEDLDNTFFYFLNTSFLDGVLAGQQEYLKKRLFIQELWSLGSDRVFLIGCPPSLLTYLAVNRESSRSMTKDLQVLENDFSSISDLWNQSPWRIQNVAETLDLHPGLISRIEEYYQREKAKTLALLKKWPRCDQAIDSLIELSLVLDKDKEETKTRIATHPVSRMRDQYTLAANAFRAYHDKNIPQAEQLFRQFFSEYTDINPLFYYMVNKTTNLARQKN